MSSSIRRAIVNDAPGSRDGADAIFDTLSVFVADFLRTGGSAAGESNREDILNEDALTWLGGLPGMFSPIGKRRCWVRPTRQGRTSFTGNDNVVDDIVNNIWPGYDPANNQAAKRQKNSAPDRTRRKRHDQRSPAIRPRCG
jgi:hypothetical protein